MLVLTYAGGSDGFCAQYQRILGIYCISKEFNIPYYHTGFKNIKYQGLAQLVENKKDDEYETKFNRRTVLPSDVTETDIADFEERKVERITLESLQSIMEEAKTKNILCKISLPYGITDKNPEIYRHIQGIYNTVVPKNDIFTIGIHVRRGDLFVVESWRMLPNSYYIKVCNFVVNILNRLSIPFVVELYTEVPTKNAIITGEHIGDDSTTIVNARQNKIEEFDAGIPNLHKYINEDLEKTFDRMINCDLLITSRSSLSAVASYLKPRGISLYHPFWHNMRNKDISVASKNILHRVVSFIREYREV